jgi:hypothetical protein
LVGGAGRLFETSCGRRLMRKNGQHPDDDLRPMPYLALFLTILLLGLLATCFL